MPQQSGQLRRAWGPHLRHGIILVRAAFGRSRWPQTVPSGRIICRGSCREGGRAYGGAVIDGVHQRALQWRCPLCPCAGQALKGEGACFGAAATALIAPAQLLCWRTAEAISGGKPPAALTSERLTVPETP